MVTRGLRTARGGLRTARGGAGRAPFGGVRRYVCAMRREGARCGRGARDVASRHVESEGGSIAPRAQVGT